MIDKELRELIWGASSISAGMDDYGALPDEEQEAEVEEALSDTKALMLKSLPKSKHQEHDSESDRYTAWKEGYNDCLSEIKDIFK